MEWNAPSPVSTVTSMADPLPDMDTRESRRRIIAWALYDWGNSAFALGVMTVFFPIFLGRYWIGEQAVNSTFVLGMANGAASLVIVLLAPILGAIADAAAARKRWLASFAFMGALMCLMLGLVGAGHWLPATLLFVLGVIGFSGANVFYDALLVGIARPDDRERVSALGFALGYLGGSVLFMINTLMVMKPQWFGLADAAVATRLAFVTVGLWWAAFTLPLLWRVAEPAAVGERRAGSAVRAGLRQLAATIRHVRQLRPVALFLLAYWLYIDGVDTIVRMAVDFGTQLGFDTDDLILAILLTNLIGFPATIGFGLMARRTGAKSGILLGIGVYMAITIGAYFVTQAWHFYLLAAAVGLVQGGVQATSRAFYSRLIPPDRSAEFFGFYNMLGKFAAVLGPVMVAWTSAVTGDPRAAILTVLILFVAGGLLLLRVPARPSTAAD